jgi:sugar lactone lactonase YvrE
MNPHPSEPKTRSRAPRALAIVAPAIIGIAIVIALGPSCSKSSSSPSQVGSDAACVTPDAAAPDVVSGADADSLAGLPAPASITLTTLAKTPLVIEGLTADGAGNLYAAGRGGTPSCPVWRFAPASGTATVVGTITAPCSPNGLTFNATGDLFIGDGDKVYRLTPNDQAPPVAAVFASGVPIANGLAFDRGGKLWVSDGTTSQGRVWSVATDGTATEAFRVQPLANDVNLVANPDGGADAAPSIGGVGRDPRALPPGSLTITPTTRAAADSLGSVAVVANGLAFAPDGSLLVADTARGAIWRATFDAQGALSSHVGCDTTFTANTLCLENVFVQHPILEGVDGIALDAAGNIWGAINERNAIAVVTPQGSVREVFRNPPDATTKLRNGGPLEYPTSPFLVDKKLCITQSDTSRRDNFPGSGGEVGPGIAGPLLGKLSCLDQAVPTAGLPLPVH